MIWEIWVAGVAQPQGSARGFKAGNRVIITTDNKNLRPWRHAVTSEVQQKMAFAGPEEPLAGPIGLELVFVFPRLKGHYGSKGLLASAPREHAVRPDLDKLARAVIDALADAGLLRNDAQVAALMASKRYGDRPGCQIRLSTEWEIAPASDVVQPSTMAS
jgi:Holliday junction resolvase RusA-like endonuclease